MKAVYIAVRCDYLYSVPWPEGARYGGDAMQIIWGIDNVEFVRNDHPLGDLYKVLMTDEDKVAFVLKATVGTIVTDIDAIKKW